MVEDNNYKFQGQPHGIFHSQPVTIFGLSETVISNFFTYKNVLT
jgi:hypothetical protein